MSKRPLLEDDIRLLNVLRADVVAFGLGGKSDPTPYLEAFDRAIAAFIDHDDVKRLRTEIKRNALVQTELRENLITQRDDALRQVDSAFLAGYDEGWSASGEGHNGEYVRESKDEDDPGWYERAKSTALDAWKAAKP